jgi:hypothetical protein
VDQLPGVVLVHGHDRDVPRRLARCLWLPAVRRALRSDGCGNRVACRNHRRRSE